MEINLHIRWICRAGASPAHPGQPKRSPYKSRCSFALNIILAGLAAGLVSGTVLHAADQLLFGPSFEAAKIEARDAMVSVPKSDGDFVLRMTTGHEEQWPGITISAPAGCWDLSACSDVMLKVKNAGKNQVAVHCRVDNAGADGVKNCANGSVTLAPGEANTLKVALNPGGDDLGGKLFGMRGYPAGSRAGGSGLDPSKVTALVIFVSKSGSDNNLEIGEIRATGTATHPTASVTDATPYFPFIDTFGQYKHRDWPGKIKSTGDLAYKGEAEAEELSKNPVPEGRDKFGGWSDGPSVKATGFFRTEKYRGKWWLVDPDGHLFFSQGIDCVLLLDSTPVDERGSWFDDFPGGKPEFKTFWRPGFALHGHYEGRSLKCFSFAGANLLRKYGPDWQTIYPDIIQKRLRSWGLNTIGNWSDEKTRLMDRTPYTDNIGSFGVKIIQGSEGYWGKFPDVFDPSFSEALRRGMASKAGKSAGDPWCIGYFSDNEMSWGDETSLGLAALKSPPDQAAKKEFIADLKAKYETIDKLNAAWNTRHDSWDALLASREAPDKTKARADLAAFYSKTSETYFRKVHDTIKAVAPHQLYLGCRFAWVNNLAAVAASKYCDVVSYNLYNRSIADFQFPGGDKPLIVGEFHFGALDRGLFHTGLVPVANQEARAASYRDYMLGAARHPLMVGAHWFQWQDEPTTGRALDEENYQIGFVDVADTPYPEIVGASRWVAGELYRVRAGK
jgi:hypothetical protein